MMKMQMKLQKHQIASLPLYIEWTNAWAIWDRSLYSMAGYTDFDVVLIGAAGGQSGIAWGDTAHNISMRGAGGGGGGVLRAQGKLAVLPAQCGIFVSGTGGANGTDSATRSKAGDGNAGYQTVFGPYTAYGGAPGKGGDFKLETFRQVSFTGFHDVISVDIPAKGGDGGGTNPQLGTKGLGGTSGHKLWDNDLDEIVTGTYADNAATVAATAGTSGSTTLADGTVLSGGSGGGGGAGAFHMNGTQQYASGAGGNGAGGTGQPLGANGAAAGTTTGGGGGGGNSQPVKGSVDYHGTGSGDGGFIALKIS